MKPAVENTDDRGEVEGAGDLCGDANGIGGGGRPVIAEHDIERLGGDELLREVGRRACNTGSQGRRDRRVRQIGGDQRLEFADEPMREIWRQVQVKHFHRDGPVVPVFAGLGRTKHRTERSSANLMEHPKSTEGVRRGSASFPVQ
jgi:hypothetical protein